MAFVLPENVQETSTTTGTGQLTLDGAVTGALEFDSQLANNDTVFYSIKDDTDIEVGVGTFTNSAGNKLSRDTILYSTAGAGTPVDWTTGTRNVLATMPGTALGSLTEPGSTSGVIAQIAANTYARREITGSKGIQITNGGGVLGDIDVNGMVLSPVDSAFGATGDGISDDTAELMACIAEAESTGAAIDLGPYDYLISGSCLTIEKGIHVYGHGNLTRLMVAASVGATTDIITLSPSTTSDDANTFFWLENFRIQPVSGTPGRHGVAIDITTRALYNSTFNRLRIDQLGSEAIATLPAGTPLVDGFFTSVIQESVLFGGIKLDKAGDSIRILRNTITGAGVGIYADLWCNNPGVDCFDGGPHGLEIVGNNITCINGALDARNASMGIFENNVVEVPAGGTLHNNASISIDGIPANLIDSFSITKNYLSTSAGHDVVYFGYANQCIATNNYSARKIGYTHFRVSANAVNTRLLDCYSAGGEARATMLEDLGTSTLWWRSWAGVIDTNQGIKLDAGTDVTYEDSGGIEQPLISLEPADDTCKVGFISPVTQEGHLLMYANGTERMRITPEGAVIVGDTSLPAGLTPKDSAALQIETLTRGFYPPRLTTTEKNAISTPEAGCVVYDSTLKGLSFYDGTGWITAQA